MSVNEEPCCCLLFKNQNVQQLEDFLKVSIKELFLISPKCFYNKEVLNTVILFLFFVSLHFKLFVHYIKTVGYEK